MITGACAASVSALLSVILAAGMAAATANGIAYAYRWMVTVVGADRAIAPPLTPVWERSPVWFERWMPGGFSESLSRRLAHGPDGVVTVIRRELYGLDAKTGRSAWTLPLQGEEIFDWKIVGDTLVYASYGHKKAERLYWGIRAAIDLRQRREIWASRRPATYLDREWIVLVSNRIAIYGNEWTNDLTALSMTDGAELWKVPQTTGDDYPVTASWFVYGNVLHALAGQKNRGGLFLKGFDITTGAALPLLHLVGSDAVSNLHAPCIVTPDGRLVVEYYAFRREKAWIIAYDLRDKKLLWDVQVVDGTESKNKGVVSGKTIAGSDVPGRPVVATYWPGRYLLLNPATGAVVKDAALRAYEGWTEHNAVLYSYPYLITSARRAVDAGMAYDLIVLNLETGGVDWSYEIGRRNGRFITASSEILNFLVRDRDIFVSRTDARVMAFRASAPSSASKPSPPRRQP